FPRETGEPAPRESGDFPAPSDLAGVGRGGRDREDYNLETVTAQEISRAQHIAAQVAPAVSDPAQRRSRAHFGRTAGRAGSPTGDLTQVAEKLGAPLAGVDAVLAVIQSFAPSGIGARNLAECLAIQLRERDRFDPAMQALVANLDLVARRDLAALRRLCGVD